MADLLDTSNTDQVWRGTCAQGARVCGCSGEVWVLLDGWVSLYWWAYVCLMGVGNVCVPACACVCAGLLRACVRACVLVYVYTRLR